MSALTKIEWAHRTWNPTRGCFPISPGCDNCYAARFAYRFSGPGQPYEGLVEMSVGGPQWTGKLRFVPEALAEPKSWRKPQDIFVDSMSDLFHARVSFEDVALVCVTMASVRGRHHTYRVLSKRADRMRSFFAAPGRLDYVYTRWYGADDGPAEVVDWPLPNLQLGISAEDQPRLDQRLGDFIETPAALRFLSLEPLLGPILIPSWARKYIGWVIVGGESGPGARPMHPDWVRSLRGQCMTAGIPFFFKQWGDWAPVGKAGTAKVVTLDGRLIELNEDAMRRADRERRLERATTTYRVGKKAAGRVLDGRTWDEFPEVRR